MLIVIVTKLNAFTLFKNQKFKTYRKALFVVDVVFLVFLTGIKVIKKYKQLCYVIY